MIYTFLTFAQKFIKTNKNMENKKLTRSNNKMLAGVCAGLAEHYGWDTTIVRIIYALLTVFTAFCGVIVYIILCLVMPAKQ